MEPWPLACPRCRAPLGPLRAPGDTALPDEPGDAIVARTARDPAAGYACPACGAYYPPGPYGTWDLLVPGAAERFAPFLAEYTAVRRAEGRAHDDPARYRALPRAPADDPLAWQWRIRARSAAALLRGVLPGLGPAPRALDVGAGTGWLSRMLAERGARPLALDVSLDPGDGLGAMRHLDALTPGGWLPRARADFDRLPLADGSADLVVFNASLHYSPDVATTLSEALRVLAGGPNARLVVADSPRYRRRRSGEAMVAERKAAYRDRYGFASDALGSAEFLVDAELDALGADLGVRWRTLQPWYGLRWALRPLRARLRAAREPARLGLVVGRRVVP